jgi:phosphatidylserine/phosphatidylglycerophosphate/cardiolipin synthase-like enzyme
VRIREPELVAALGRVFEADWALASGEQPALSTGDAGLPPEDEPPTWIAVPYGAGTVAAAIVASPRDWLPPGVAWDLPAMVRMIDAASATVRVQLLTYRAVGRDGSYFDALEGALRRAAARQVRVELLIADWAMRRGTIEGLQSLQALPGITVKLVTIPPWSGGFIPYARVIHAKYLVVDGENAWIGTSNWEHDYFYASRNVGLVVRGTALAGRLEAFFRDGWEGPYAREVDPCAQYEAPRIGE